MKYSATISILTVVKLNLNKMFYLKMLCSALITFTNVALPQFIKSKIINNAATYITFEWTIQTLCTGIQMLKIATEEKNDSD